jgi:hypothetical protein
MHLPNKALTERIVERFAELRATGDSTISSG